MASPASRPNPNSPFRQPSTPFGEQPLLVLTSTRVLLSPSHAIAPYTIIISPQTGRVLSIHPSLLPPNAFPISAAYHDVSPYVILPGLVDAHVHLNEPGRTEWEGFDTGTRAAASGGVTTVIDMPLNAIPPTTTVQGLAAKVEAARGKCWVDVGFWGGVVPGNAGELVGLVDGGVRGFKGFLCDSGVEEFPAVGREDVREAMEVLKGEVSMLMFHAELITRSEEIVKVRRGAETAYEAFLRSRPPVYETAAVEEILGLAHVAAELPLHVVHLSAVETIPLLREAREKGTKITAETCFHYLCLTAEEMEDGDARRKCCPPIRERRNQDALWEELLREDSVIRTVVSDHSPCTPALKNLPSHQSMDADASRRSSAAKSAIAREDFMAAWGGISSLGLGLSLLYTASVNRSPTFTLQRIVDWTSTATAAQAGLAHRKGQLAVGFDADLVIFDDEATWMVAKESLRFKNKMSAYEGRRLTGLVRETWVRGRRVFQRPLADEDVGGFDETVGPVGELLLERRGQH